LKRRVAVLGATGLVGQRLVSMLSRHPWFELVFVASSERAAGRRYGEHVKWIIEDPMPQRVAEMRLENPDADSLSRERVDVVFTALAAEVAEKLEPELAKRGFAVISNSGGMRLEPDIPLLVPEVNADHVDAIEFQRKHRGWSGFIVKAPNCTAAILTLSLKPLVDEYGVRRVLVSTMQAISGAGLTGLPSMFIQDNLIPYIEGEEESMERETLKMLGALSEGVIKPSSDISISASCHRVPVLEGHTMTVFAELARKPGSIEEVVKVLEEFSGNKIKGLGLPSAPSRPIVVRREADRPQPRLDRWESGGMSIVVGRVREDHVIGGVKYIAVGHNTVRGTAGNSVLIAELLAVRGYI